MKVKLSKTQLKILLMFAWKQETGNIRIDNCKKKF